MTSHRKLITAEVRACCYGSGCGSVIKISGLVLNPLRCTYLSTSKYGSRVLLATYTSYYFCLHRYLIKKWDHNDTSLSTEATFGFCLLFQLSCFSTFPSTSSCKIKFDWLQQLRGYKFFASPNVCSEHLYNVKMMNTTRWVKKQRYFSFITPPNVVDLHNSFDYGFSKIFTIKCLSCFSLHFNYAATLTCET